MMPISNLVMLFDVDGVLTDEFARVDAEAVRLLVDLIGRRVRTALISGRSRTWLEERVFPALAYAASHNGDPNALDGLVLAAEMGAVRRTGIAAGHWERDQRFQIAAALRTELRQLCESDRFAPFLFWDATKDVIATVECRQEPEARTSKEETRRALAGYEVAADAMARPYGCRAARSSYTLDVLPADISKEVGARFALQYLSGTAPQAGVGTVIVLGDSQGDVLMARAARNAGRESVRFIWLGEGPAPCEDGVVVEVAAESYAPGTRRVLSSLIAQLEGIDAEA